jgi:4-amino-4-deoxy-L-arabinose transferase-like glycosyltransferase
VAIITLIGLAIRVYRLGNPLFIYDEYQTYFFATEPLGRIFSSDYYVETNPPLYYLLQRAWLIFGDHRWVMRLLPLLLGLPSIPLTFVLGRRVLGVSAGLIGSLLVATSPMHIFYSRAIRTYSALTTLSLLALACVARILASQGLFSSSPDSENDGGSPTPEPSKGTGASPDWCGAAWAGYLLSTLVMLWLHSTAVLLPVLVMALVGGLVATRRLPPGMLWRWGAANVLLAVLYGPWLLVMLWQTRHVLKEFWEVGLSASEFAGNLMGAYSCTKWAKPFLYLLPLMGIWRLRRKPVVLAFLLVFVIGQPLLTALASFRHSVFFVRVLIWPTPLTLLLSGAAVAGLRSRFGTRGVVAASLLVAGAQLVGMAQWYPREPEQADSAAFVEPLRGFRKGEDTFLIAPLEDVSLWYEIRELRLPRNGWGMLYGDAHDQLERWWGVTYLRRDELSRSLSGVHRVWLVRKVVPPVAVPEAARFQGVLSTLDTWGTRQGTWRSGNQELVLYAERGR